jgi:hypothetical protein
MENGLSKTTDMASNSAGIAAKDRRTNPLRITKAFEMRLSRLGGLVMKTQAESMWARIARSMAVFTILALAGMSAAQAASVTLKVVAARNEPALVPPATVCTPGVTQICKGTTVVSAYKYLINVDNTGTTEQRSPTPGTGCSPQDAGYPATCNWVSIAGAKGASPVLTQGQTTAGTVALTICDSTTTAGCIPAGRYLVSVLADGYKLDGQHFTVTGSSVIVDGAPVSGNIVTVPMQPAPLPDATIQAAVFEDVSPVNSAPDLPAEHGLAGFQGHITDTLGEVTTNVYGDPLCSKYDAAGLLIPGSGGRCLSACYVVSNGLDVGTVAPVDVAGRCPSPLDAGGLPMIGGGIAPAGSVIEGKVKIPNLGTNRYALSVTPPDGSGWVQTTTLEGNHDWDAWVMEGATGLDTEFIIAGEPFPAIIFGYVPAPGTPSAVGSALVTGSLGGTGTIKGLVERVKIYVPTTGGVGGLPGDIWGGLQGAVLDKPEDKAWVTLTNLGNGDTIVWAGPAGADGKFTIPNVPAGTYTLTWWDEPQNQILDLVNVTIAAGETVDMGILPLAGWWTVLDGYVFDDLNRNGVRDPGEQGLSGYTLTLRRRDNTLMDRGSTAVTTDATGYYRFEAGYPMTQWLVMEAYDDLHYGTGVTFQADNQPTPTTALGAGVDVSVLPIIGLSGRLDWGKHTYDATGANGVDPRNGGIVGTVSYDTTRNELDPRYAAVEDWQPSIPDLVVKLWEPARAASGCIRLNASGSNAAAATCDATGLYALDPTTKAIAKGQLLNTYVTETWFRPGTNGNGTGCIVRGADGTPVTAADQNFLPLDQANSECIEAPMTGVQFSPDAANVNGNYGFGDGCFGPNNVLDATDPSAPVCRDSTGADVGFTTLPGARDYLVEVDLMSQVDLQGQPIYKVTREEDINIGNGDEFIPAVPPSACAGALHVVDSSGNANFPGGPGTSPYEGQNKPLCDMKLVKLSNGSSIAPSFNIFTDVPLPGRHWFIIIDDLNFSSNPKSITFGEKAGMPFVPVGIYDYDNRLVTTVESDYNGLADVLLPSTNRINCPTPSGVCANLYRYVGNDPGVPGRLNLNFNPTFRTIAAEFEVMPGVLIPADLAPTQVGVTVQLPGGQTTSPVMCMLDDTQPQLYAVNDPVVNATQRNLVINGAGFGSAGTLTLGSTALTPTSWSDTQIAVTVPTAQATGPQQLMITRTDNGLSTVNGLTIHVTGGSGAGPALPNLGAIKDNFGRNNSNTLGGNWAQVVGNSNFACLFLGGGSAPCAATRVNNNQALGATAGTPIWNTGNGSIFNSTQAAAVTLVSPVNGVIVDTGVILKAGGGNNTALPQNYIRVVYESGFIQVRTTVGLGLVTTTYGSIPATFVSGDRLTAAVDNTGTVYVWKTSGATTTYLGSVSLPTTGANSFVTGGGRIGMLVPANARVDDFGGGNVTLTGGGGSGGYNPMLYAVGPGKTYVPAETLPDAADHAIQRALNDAATFVGASPANANRGALVVVYPNTNTPANPRQNPRGAYYENLIINAKVKLQGVGPGSPDGSVKGSIIDGAAFAGDSPVATDWYTQIGTLTTIDGAGNAVPTWGGNSTIYDGAVISLYVPSSGNRAFPTSYNANTAPSIDGFDLRGGDQAGFPGNINAIGGGPTGLPGGLITQGGAIFANAYARQLQITNNVVQNNGGAYGTIRIGTPDLPAPDTNNHNEGLVIAHNRVIANAGTNQAGGIGIFTGADNYQVRGNDICGNFSSEYGGGISHVGRSDNGTINNNRIYFNRSFDEGGGIMIAGALPATTTALSPGSGPVSIYNNLIQANLANDDGGGLRFLMAGNFPMDVYNNFIVNNISTHEGGGVALNDTPNVRFYNNTVMKNLSTATAITSNGAAAPAGLSTSQNSAQLQATLPGGVAGCGTGTNAPCFSNPLLFNNIFWDNRAGTRTGSAVIGLSTADADHWDLGVADGAQQLSPTNSIVQQTRPYVASPTNSTADPQVVTPYDVAVTFNSWRNNPGFLGAIMISADLPPNLLGNYHLQNTSPAINLGAANKSGVNAPATDIDNQARPAAGGFESGADEVGSATPPPPPPPPPPSVSASITNVSLGTLSGTTLNFGSVNGTVSSTLTYTVTGGSVVFGNVSVQGGNGNRFSLAGSTCQGTTVANGGTCTVTVNFNGAGNTLRTGALTVTVSGSPTTLTLTGQ